MPVNPSNLHLPHDTPAGVGSSTMKILRKYQKLGFGTRSVRIGVGKGRFGVGGCSLVQWASVGEEEFVYGWTS